MKSKGLDSNLRAQRIIILLQKASQEMIEPASSFLVARYGRNPFIILIGCILSLRTKDTVSLPASIRLFEYAKTPNELLNISLQKIQELIYPVGFYRVKTQTLHKICHQLLQKHGGIVPSNEIELLQLSGVGRKTANLVLAEAFLIPALCVDTHVHRISNRLGLVKTKTPQETEQALKQVLPEKYWISYTRFMVTWGQNICVPMSPRCSSCVLAPLCPKVGVSRHR